MEKNRLGALGEAFTAKILEEEGHKVLERNYRTRAGEIDLITEKDGRLYFIEVKTRRSDRFGRPAEAVTGKKQERLRHAATLYLQKHGGEDGRPCSFQVAEIMYHNIPMA